MGRGAIPRIRGQLARSRGWRSCRSTPSARAVRSSAGFLLFSPPGSAPDITSLARWAQEVVPAVREMIAKEAD
jgi:hypothetical protein